MSWELQLRSSFSAPVPVLSGLVLEKEKAWVFCIVGNLDPCGLEVAKSGMRGSEKRSHGNFQPVVKLPLLAGPDLFEVEL